MLKVMSEIYVYNNNNIGYYIGYYIGYRDDIEVFLRCRRKIFDIVSRYSS
jgi:hypothetical protein